MKHLPAALIFTPRGSLSNNLKPISLPNPESGGTGRVEPREAVAQRACNAAPLQPPRNIANVAIPFRYFLGIGSIVKMSSTHREQSGKVTL